jgi:hypothetical protein
MPTLFYDNLYNEECAARHHQRVPEKPAFRENNELPILATANDIREVVQYLKQRPEGINICDVVQPIKKRIFYPPKIEAYLQWGLIAKKGDRINLTARGFNFAQSLIPEARAYRLLLHDSEYYSSVLQWINDEQLDVVTKDDVAGLWIMQFPVIFGETETRKLQQSVVTFFHICQAAELGSFTIGKRGQPGRLRVWRSALAEWLNLAQSRFREPGGNAETIHLLISDDGRAHLLDQIQNLLREIGVQSEVIGSSKMASVSSFECSAEV